MMILGSQKTAYWTLSPDLSFDYFGIRAEGSAALLLIGMHLTDPMPWLCARHPLYLRTEPGLIDMECKRILGKRFRQEEILDALPRLSIDPIARLLEVIDESGHDFQTTPTHPDLMKRPGQLLPRRLQAEATVHFAGQSVQLHARNFSERSQCLHAELTLIFALSRMLSTLAQPPDRLDSFHLHSTWKPCKMCAAFLHAVRGRCAYFRVSYDEDDPGRLAANTLLDREGYQSGP